MTKNELLMQKLFNQIIEEIKQNSKRLESIEDDLTDIFISIENLQSEFEEPCILDNLN